MLPAFLITFREVIEATLIVATILGILVKLQQKSSIKTVWLATLAAGCVSIALLGIGSLIGVKFQEVYTGTAEELIEGVLMMISAVFITGAVFFLHKYFAQYKTHLLTKIKSTVQEPHRNRALFILVFTAVFREGIEIVLFLSTIYLSSNPQQIFSGFTIGMVAALFVSFALFKTTLKMPVYVAFRFTSILLILFAAGLLARGVHEFVEAGLIPEIYNTTMNLIPAKDTFAGDMVKAIFGVSRSMDLVQMSVYIAYILIMNWWLFIRTNRAS
jgi:high-affinity iron transporter